MVSGLTLLYIVIAVLVDGLAGLAGGLLPSAFVQTHIGRLLAFAAGSLVGSVFLDMLPDALTSPHVPPPVIMVYAMLGFLLFYSIETVFGSHATGQAGHKHGHSHDDGHDTANNNTNKNTDKNIIGPLLLLGDALHNISDGVAIAAAFMANTATGVIASLAVILHEIPQEVGDFAILVANGYPRSRALVLLALVQLSALIGALIALWLSAHVVDTAYFLALSSGGFLYVAAADLLPELRKQKSSHSGIPRLAAFCGGIALIAVIQKFI